MALVPADLAAAMKSSLDSRFGAAAIGHDTDRANMCLDLATVVINYLTANADVDVTSAGGVTITAPNGPCTVSGMGKIR